MKKELQVHITGHGSATVTFIPPPNSHDTTHLPHTLDREGPSSAEWQAVIKLSPGQETTSAEIAPPQTRSTETLTVAITASQSTQVKEGVFI